MDFRINYLDQGYHWIRSELTRLNRKEWRCKTIYGVVKNITELKKAEAELAAVHGCSKKYLEQPHAHLSLQPDHQPD